MFFREYYVLYSELVTRVANSILHDADLAQDVCQDIFIKLYENIESINEETVSSWLVICTKRKAIDYIRIVKKQMKLQESIILQEYHMLNQKEEDIADIVCAVELSYQLLKKLKKENKEWYEILVRVSVNQEDPNIVAQEMKLSISNLRTKLHRARKWSSQLINNYENEK